MSDELAELQARIVDAVQTELTRFSREVAAELNSLRADIDAEAAAKTELQEQMASLASTLESSRATNTTFQDDLHRAIEKRLADFDDASTRRHDELNTRLGRVVDEANNGISAVVESAVRPIVGELEERQDELESAVVESSSQLERLEGRASTIVDHINQVTGAVEDRLDGIQNDVLTSFEARQADIVARIDEVSAHAARQQSEVAKIVSDRVEASEVKINDKLITAESRMREEIGEQVAQIDAHVGNVSAGLDDAVITLNDRIADNEAKNAEVLAAIEEIREEVDVEAIDEIKEKIGSALGQAELVRIEMDRFKGEVTGVTDKMNVRMSDLETQVQDQFLDVETSIQLERLEEIERAMLLLDPEQFVRRDEFDPDVYRKFVESTGAMKGPETLDAPASAPLAPPSSDPDGALPAGAPQAPPVSPGH